MDDQNTQNNDGSLYITSVRRPGDKGPVCRLEWEGTHRYAPVSAVRQTAEDLMTCAAYADLVTELLTVGLGAPELNGLTTEMLKKREPRYFGTPHTVFLLFGGDSKRRQGVVLLGRDDLFHEGKADGVLLPDEARAMARAWMEAAEASEADTLFDAALRSSELADDDQLEELFAVLREIRADKTPAAPA